MNLTATSKEDILKASRALIQQNGWAAVNIRAVAAACGVSVGCIYNYFASAAGIRLRPVSRLFHPSLLWLYAPGHGGWKTADAAGVAAHPAAAVFRLAAGPQRPAGRLQRPVHRRTVCRGPVFPDAFRAGAAGFRPVHGAGDRPAGHLLKNFPRFRGDFLSIKVNIVQLRR